MQPPDSVKMNVGALTLDPATKTPVVLLKDDENQVSLPIWIGLLEATSIATELEGLKMARPMTHDLLRNLISHLGATVTQVEITDLRENTYYAIVRVRDRNGVETGIDSRPSDAISLALRTRSPIFVARTVLAASTASPDPTADDTETNLSGVSRDQWGEILEKMTPDDFKYKM